MLISVPESPGNRALAPAPSQPPLALGVRLGVPSLNVSNKGEGMKTSTQGNLLPPRRTSSYPEV